MNMKLIDWLRKLGILRFGGEAAVYRNANDRPLSFQMDGVFDSKKDVIDIGKKDKAQAGPGKAGKRGSRAFGT